MKKLFVLVFCFLLTFGVIGVLFGSEYVGLGEALDRVSKFNFDYTETVKYWKQMLDYFSEVFSEFEDGNLIEYWNRLKDFLKGGGSFILACCNAIYETGKGIIAVFDLLFYLVGIY